MTRLVPMNRRSRFLAALLGVVAIAGGGSIAWADIPDSGVINGCYKTASGGLRVIDKSAGGACNSSETSLTWNQTGATGAIGPAGATGPPGPTGPTGPSNAYTNYPGGDHMIAVGDTQTIASVTLPVGQYTLSGTLEVDAPNSLTALDCNFVSVGTVHGQTIRVTTPDIREAVSVIGDVTVTTNNTGVFFRCKAFDDVADVNAGGMIATQVGTITPSS